jgi:hypothetical protein
MVPHGAAMRREGDKASGFCQANTKARPAGGDKPALVNGQAHGSLRRRLIDPQAAGDFVQHDAR